MPLFRRRQPSPENSALAERLDALEFFRYADDPAGAQEAVASTGVDGLYAENGRHLITSDAEDLAEGGVAAWLEELRPVLARLGAGFEAAEDRFERDDHRYVVTVDGREYEIYDTDDMAEMWALAWTRGFRIINDVLERSGVPERAYSGSEYELWLLTPEQFAAVQDVLDERERPYVPTEDPPDYGARPR